MLIFCYPFDIISTLWYYLRHFCMYCLYAIIHIYIIFNEMTFSMHIHPCNRVWLFRFIMVCVQTGIVSAIVFHILECVRTECSVLCHSGHSCGSCPVLSVLDWTSPKQDILISLSANKSVTDSNLPFFAHTVLGVVTFSLHSHKFLYLRIPGHTFLQKYSVLRIHRWLHPPAGETETLPR